MTDNKNFELLEALLAAQSQPDFNATAETLLSQHADPRMRMLAKLMAQKKPQEQEIYADPDDEPEEVETVIFPDDEHAEDEKKANESRVRENQYGKKGKIKQQFREVFKNMKMEIEALRELNDTLAEALGACYLDWGGDPKCSNCQGKGRPGWKVPNQEFFDEIVAPALERVRQQKSLNHHNSNNNSPVSNNHNTNHN